VARFLEYDDHESMLLSSLVRTGSWLQPEVSSRLAMQLEAEQEDEQQQQLAPGAAPPAPSPPDGVSSSHDDRDAGAVDSSSSSSSSSSAPGAPLPPPKPQNFWIAVRLLEGRVHARVRICGATFRPLGVSYPLSGDMEVWKFKGWRLWTTDLQFPESMVHYANTGAFHRRGLPALGRPCCAGCRHAGAAPLAFPHPLAGLPPCSWALRSSAAAGAVQALRQALPQALPPLTPPPPR
jgi:hypothetical protein